MIEIKALETGSTQGHWYYGPDYMVRVGESVCKLFGVNAPKMGYMCTVKKITLNPRDIVIKQDCILELQNISGDYFLACVNVAIADWPDVFGVRVGK